MVTIRKKSNIAEQSGTSPQREGESRGGTVVGRSTVGNVTITRMKRPTPTTAGSNPASERVETIPVPKWTQVQADWQSRFDQVREGRQAEQETVSAAGQGGQIGRFIGAAQRGGGFQNVVGTPQNTQAKLSALESEKSRLEAGLDLEGAARVQKQIDATTKQIKAAENSRREEAQRQTLQAKWREYQSLAGKPDFEERSQYRTTANGREEKLNLLTGKYTETGYSDVLYDAVNGDKTARDRLLNAHTDRSYDLEGLSGDTVKLFNYLYQTQGPETAYDYLDLASGRDYTGAQAASLGMLQSVGLPSVSAALGAGLAQITSDKEMAQRNQAWYGGLLQDAAGAQQQHPAAYGAGNVAGGLALLGGVGGGLALAGGGLSTGISIGGKTVAVQLPPAVQGIVNSGLTFLTADAVQNAGAAATGNMSGGDYLQSMGISGIQGIAGGLAGGLTGSGMANVLRRTGMMTPFMEFVRQTTSGFVSASANIGTGYALREDKPSREQIATDFATAFLFSVIQGGISTYRTTQQNKAKMDAAYKRIAEQYSNMSQNWESMTPEARAERAMRISQFTQDLRGSLNHYYMAGQQKTVDSMNSALDAIDAAIQGYINGFTASGARWDMLGGPAAPGGVQRASSSVPPTVGGDEAALLTQLQTAVEQGFAAAEGGNTPAGVLPAVGALNSGAGSGPVMSGVDQPLTAGTEAVPELEGGSRTQADHLNGLVLEGRSLGEKGTRAYMAAYDGSVPAPDFYREFAQYYHAGYMGREPVAAGQREGGRLTSAQRYAAYTAGENDARSVDKGRGRGYSGVENRVNEEGLDDEGAAAVHLRDGGQRINGTDSGGKLRAVAEGAGQDQGRTVPGGPADRGTAALTYGEKVSTASLGIGGGETRAGIRLVTGGETDATRAAKAMGKARGLRVTLFGGGNLIIHEAGGVTASARAYLSGDRVFIRADHPEYTAEQLMRHEGGHDAIARGEVDPGRVRRRIEKSYGAARTRELAGMYEAAYRESGLTPEEVWEEVICDSLGDMNIFSGTTLEGPAGQLLDETKKAASAQLERIRPRGPPVEEDKENVYRGTGKEDVGRVSSATDQREDSRGIGERSRTSREDGESRVVPAGQRYGGVDPSFGKTPIRAWVKNSVIAPKRGTAAYRVQQEATAYGIPSFVVSDTVWEANKGSTPAFSAGGQIYLRETMPEEYVDTFVPHEATHVMKQAGYQPYLEFLSRTPDMVDRSMMSMQRLLSGVAKHRDIDLFNLKADEITILYDELNATVYGAIAAGDAGVLELIQDGFLDFDSYAAELTAIHEGFKVDQMGGGKSKFSQELSSIVGLTGEERGALLRYKSSESYQINAKLRDGAALTEQEQRFVELMDSALAKLSVYKGTVYRTLSFDDFGGEKAYNTFTAIHIEGAPVFYNAYLSASTITEGYPVEGRYTVKMIIDSATARDMVGFGNNFESEVVFKRNCSFLVQRVTYAENGSPTIYLREDEESDTGDDGQLHSEERSRTVRDMQKPHQGYNDLQGVSKENPYKNFVGEGGSQRAVSGGQRDSLRGQGGRTAQESAFRQDHALKERGEHGVGQLHSEERSVAVRDLQEAHSAHVDLQGVPGADTRGNHGRGENLQGAETEVREESGGEKFSQELAELEALRRENERLKGRVERLKGETRRTTRETLTLRQGDVDKLARSLVQGYNSTLNAAEISPALKRLGEYLLRGGDGRNELTWGTVHDMALDIGQKLVESAVVKDDAAYRQYSDLRKYLRTTKLHVPREMWADLETGGGYNEFRKVNMGRLLLSSAEGTDIDQAYQELANQYPEFFNEELTSHPADQLIQMADMLDGLQPIYENPYSYDMAQATEYAANEVLDGLMGEDVRQTPPTFVDRQAAKLDQARAKGRQAVQRERERRDERVRMLKDHYAQVRKNYAARRMDSAARTRLLHIAKRLQNKKLPAVNRALLDQYIGDLDTTAKSMTGGTLEKLTDLQAWYNDRRESDPDFIPDPGIERALARLSSRKIADLTAGEVAELTDVLLHIENELRTERQLIDDQDKRDIYHMGEETIQNIYNTKGSRGGVLDRFIVTETLSPVRQIRRMTGYVDSDPLLRMTNAMAEGQRAMLNYQMKAERPFEQFAADKAFSRFFSGPRAEGIQVTGYTKDGFKTVTITPAMRTALYLHGLNGQNLRHIKAGGVTVPDEKLYRKGKLAEAYARGTTIKLTPSQVRSITAGMTEKEKAFAQVAHRYFNETSRDAINETSERLKGYSLAQVDHYFPINTDTSFARSDFESLKFDGTIEGMGFLKERQAKAANPILLRDVNAVLEQAIQMHSRYVGLAIPVRNFNKVWGVTTFSLNADGSRNAYESSVQQAVKRRWGETGYGYIEKLMKDLQGGPAQKNSWVEVLNKVRGNYAGAVLTLNLSVAMKQAASYPTAAAVLGWSPLARAIADVGKVDLALIEKYTPLQWYRSKGFSTKELGDLKTAHRQLPAVLNWVQGVDLLTTRKLWKASEYYVRQHNKVLGVGTDAYFRAVAEVYNRVIEETQPNYTTMQRPQLLRSDDTLMGNLAMFKTQPFQNFNVVYDAAGNLLAKSQRAKSGGKREKEAAGEARDAFGQAVTSQLAQLAVFAGMTMAWALLRGKTDKYEDGEGEVTMQSVLTALGKDMTGGALSTVPFGADAWELLSSKLFGDAYYEMDAVTVTAVQNTLKSISGLAEMAGRIAKNAATGVETDWNGERLKLDNCLDDISKAAGVPYENVANLFKIVYRQTAVAALGKYQGGYAYLKLTTDPEKYSGDYYDLLYGAMKDSRDYEAIYSDMLSFGFHEDKIGGAMERRMKQDQGVERVEDLERRYLTPDQEQAWDGIYGEVARSGAWRSATKEQRSGLEEDLYNLVTENKTGEKLQDKIDGGAAYGISEADYLLYRLALSMVDQPTESGNLGSYTNDEVEAAIEMLTGLSDPAKSYLWTAQGKSDKNNPWG